MRCCPVFEDQAGVFKIQLLLLFYAACDAGYCSEFILDLFKIPQEANMRLSLSIISMVAAFCALTAFLYLLRFNAKRKKPRPPFTQDSLPGPGQALLVELDVINETLRCYYVFAVVSPATIFGVHLLQSYFCGAAESSVRLLVSVGGGFSFCSFSIYKITKLLNERNIKRLAYEGKRTVGRALEQLTHEGYHVYHGFSAENFTIDHVVVGPKGVFAVETKTYAKPAPKNRLEDATVEYDGRMLYFPKGEDFKTIDRAQQQASWLSEWLGKSIGEPVAARAIVALPGWYVKRTSAEGMPVVNPQQFSSLFKHIKARPLSDAMIRHIHQQLDKK